MDIGNRLTGFLLTLLGSLTLLLNQAVMLYFNSMPDFSVSGGGLVDAIGLVAFFAGLGILLSDQVHGRR